MEFYLARAHDIARLEPVQIELLHSFELKDSIGVNWNRQTGTHAVFVKRTPRCLLAHEIQEGFRIPSIKDHFQIPEDDSFQSMHVQRIRSRMKELNLVPLKPLIPLAVEATHLFDESLRGVVDELKIDFMFQGRSPGRRLKDRLAEVV